MYVVATAGYDSGNVYDTTIVPPSVAVQAGDSVVVGCGWRTSSSPASVSGITDGTNALTVSNYQGSDGYAYLGVGVLHNCSANASAVFTATLSDTFRYRAIDVYVIRPEGGETISTADAVAFASGNSASAVSGALTTTAASLVIAVAQSYATAAPWSAEQVDGVDADAYTRTGALFDSWYRALVGAETAFTSTATLNASGYWSCGQVALYASGGGGAGNPWYYYANQ